VRGTPSEECVADNAITRSKAAVDLSERVFMSWAELMNDMSSKALSRAFLFLAMMRISRKWFPFWVVHVWRRLVLPGKTSENFTIYNEIENTVILRILINDIAPPLADCRNSLQNQSFY